MPSYGVERDRVARISSLLASGELAGLPRELEHLGVAEYARAELVEKLTAVSARARGQAELGRNELALAVAIALALASREELEA